MEILDPQQLAISTIDRNLAVNAGAGTGKTKVLTERFVYILENGNLDEFKEIESIVAITFTKKATEEMMERIRAEIKKNFYKGEKWTRFYRDLDKANISTIHSFCAKLLKENPIEANIDPLFEVLEDNLAGKLLKHSIIQVLEESLEKNNEFLKLMKMFNINRIENIVEDFYSVYNNIRTVGIDFKKVKSMTMNNLQDLKVNKEDLSQIKNSIIYLSENLSKSTKIYKMVNTDDPIWISFYKENYKENELYTIIEYIQLQLGNSSKEVEHFSTLKKSIENILKTKDIKIKWLYSLVLDLLLEIDNTYYKLKTGLAVLDYDDLQIEVLKLLDNEEICKYYQNLFRYFMIDEFQDTNELQRKIFYKLTSLKNNLDKSNLFIVGDPKQSIYGFRGSDIDVFYSTIEDIINSTNEKPITMSKNYRTKNTVLDFINTIFSGLMGSKYDFLIPKEIIDDEIDIEILENNDFDNYPELKKSEISTIYEANLIAKRIKSLVNSGKYNYKDFALLFRATTRNYIYEESLKNYNIPYFNSSGKRFFFRQEILDIINALKAISNPYNNIATIGYLRSPMVGISDNSIYYLLRNKENSIYSVMSKVDGININIDDEVKIKEAIELLDYFYEIKNTKTISKIIEELIEKTYHIESTLLKRNGKQSIANIYKFVELSKFYESTNKNSLEDFIDYIEEIKVGNESEATIESEDSNVVKLLTIHKSKGLEFPVVIIPEMSRDSGGRFANLLFNKEIGLGIKSVDSSGIYDEIKNILSLKENEEKERVLYVAMTRAKERLILGNLGKNSGFKKMITEFLDYKQYNTVSDINLDMEDSKNIKLIEEQLLKKNNSLNDIKIPLLFNIDIRKKFDFYSISQYLVFSDCKKKFYMDYYHGRIESYGGDIDIDIDSNSLSSIDKGNIIHKFSELYNSNMNVELLLNNIITSYGLINTNEITKILMPYIENYLMTYSEDYDQVFLEKPFHIKIGNSYLSGVIDRINIKDDFIEILDIKTNKLVNKELLIKHYTPQIQAYAYAVGKIMSKIVSKASLLFLETGEIINIPIDKEMLRVNIESIKDFMEFVENHGDIKDYPKSLNCSYCKYKPLCL